MACRAAVGIDAVDRADLLGHALHVRERVNRRVVDVRNHESLLDTGTGEDSALLDADHLHAAPNVELAAEFRARVGEFAAQSLDHIDVLLGDQFRFTCLITQSDVDLFHVAVSFYRQFHLVVGTVACDLLL